MLCAPLRLFQVLDQVRLRGRLLFKTSALFLASRVLAFKDLLCRFSRLKLGENGCRKASQREILELRDHQLGSEQVWQDAYPESFHALPRIIQADGRSIEIALGDVLVVLAIAATTNAKKLLVALVPFLSYADGARCFGCLSFRMQWDA